MATVIDNLKNKIENGGLTAQGRLSAAEFNLLVNAEIEVIERSEVAAYIGPDDGTGGYISEGGEVDLSDYAKKTDLAAKQDVLQSGVNIKTINGETILGSGNISVSGGSGGGGDANVIESISVNGTPQTVSEKNVDITVPTKTSDLTNDSGFLTSHQDISGKANDNAVVHKTGNESISGNKLMEGIFYVGDADNYIENDNGALKLSSDSSVTLAGNAVDVETDMWVDGDITVNGGIQASDTSKQSTSKFFATDGSVQSFKTINNESIVGTGNISVSGGGSGGSGEANVIESVKVNGTALTVTNKAVDITSVPASIVTQDSTHRFVTDTEKSTWNTDTKNTAGATEVSLSSSENVYLVGAKEQAANPQTYSKGSLFYSTNTFNCGFNNIVIGESTSLGGEVRNDIEIKNVLGIRTIEISTPTVLSIFCNSTLLDGNLTIGSGNSLIMTGSTDFSDIVIGTGNSAVSLQDALDAKAPAEYAYTTANENYVAIGDTINQCITELDDAVATKVGSSDITSIVKITQADYDLLSSPSSTTLYIIIPASS